MVRVSIILLNYNGEKYASLWQSVFEQTYSDFEIVFVDNGSTDQSTKLFETLALNYKNIKSKVIRNNENLGYSPANNIGVNNSKGEYVFLLSNDVQLDKNCIKVLVEALDANQEIGVAQCMMYSLFNRSQPDAMFNYLDVLGFNHLFIQDASIPSGIVDVFYSEGAAFFTRRKLIDQVGLFDNDFFMLFEDIDYCWRIKLLGKRSVVIMDAKTYHARGGTIAGVIMKSQPRFVRLNTRNRLATLYKNYAKISVIKYLPLTMAIEIAESIWLITHKKKDSGLAVIRGIGAFFADLNELSKKRRFIQSKRSVSEKEIVSELRGINQAIENLKKLSVRLEAEWEPKSELAAKR